MRNIGQLVAFSFVQLVASAAHAQIRLGRSHIDTTALLMVAGLFVLGVGALWLAVGRKG
jgi:biotin transporter BioY